MSLQGPDHMTYNMQKTETTANSWERTQASYNVNALKKFIQESSGTVNKKQTQKAISNITKNGKYQTETLTGKNHLNWSQKIQKLSNNIQNTTLTTPKTNITNLTIKSNSTLTIQQPKTNKTHKITSKTKIKNVTDPLLNQTSYRRQITPCKYRQLAKKLYNSTNTAGTARGKPLLEPSNINTISNPEQKIIITSDIAEYNQSDVQNYAGYFSQRIPSNPDNYNNNYKVGADTKPKLETGYVIIHTGFWKSNFHKAIPQKCYLTSPEEQTPSIIDRINENNRGTNKNGVYTVLQPVKTESDIDYERLNPTGLDIIEIETISEPEAYPNFNMSRSLAEATNIQELIK